MCVCVKNVYICECKMYTYEKIVCICMCVEKMCVRVCENPVCVFVFKSAYIIKYLENN